MAVIILLIGFSLVFAVGFLISFIISVRSGQFDDTYTPSVRILLDDNKIINKNANPNPNHPNGNAKI